MRLQQSFLFHVVLEDEEEITREEAHERALKQACRFIRGYSNIFIDPKCKHGGWVTDAWGMMKLPDGRRCFPVNIIADAPLM